MTDCLSGCNSPAGLCEDTIFALAAAYERHAVAYDAPAGRDAIVTVSEYHASSDPCYWRTDLLQGFLCLVLLLSRYPSLPIQSPHP